MQSSESTNPKKLVHFVPEECEKTANAKFEETADISLKKEIEVAMSSPFQKNPLVDLM